MPFIRSEFAAAQPPESTRGVRFRQKEALMLVNYRQALMSSTRQTVRRAAVREVGAATTCCRCIEESALNDHRIARYHATRQAPSRRRSA